MAEESALATEGVAAEAHYTRAGFLGDVTVRLHDDSVSISGVRAVRGIVVGRVVVEFALLGAGLLSLLFLPQVAWWLLAAAASVFVVGYGFVWWTASDAVVTFPVERMSAVQGGRIRRPGDLMAAGHGIGPALVVSSQSALSVSFRAPGGDAGRDVRYFLMAKTQVDAARLATMLLDAYERVCPTSAST